MSIALTGTESAPAFGRATASTAWVRREFADPRAWQIGALGALLAWNIFELSMGAALLPSLVAIAATVASQALAAWLSAQAGVSSRDRMVSRRSPHGEEPRSGVPNHEGTRRRDLGTASSSKTRFALLGMRLPGLGRDLRRGARSWHLPRHDLRSPLITGLSLALLLRGDALWVPAVAGLLAVASKFLIRVDGKHLFNPAAFAILALILSGHAWVSPGQWGQSALLVTAMVFLAILVLSRAARLDTALAFLAAHAGLLVARAVWLGDPPAIPSHQLQNGALLLFASFMITDPKTTPDSRPARIVFAVAVAGIAHELAFFEQMRPALYVSLVAMNLIVPILDRICPADRFSWRQSKGIKP